MFINIRQLLSIIGRLLVVTGVYSSPVLHAEPGGPPALVQMDHPLVNKIWHVETGQFIDPARLESMMNDRQYLLLGEVHDNPRHHALQAKIIGWLVRQNKSVSVAFEMISGQQGKSIKQQGFQNTTELISILNSIDDSWPYERDYQIVFDTVIRLGFEILSANIDRHVIPQVMHAGQSVFSDRVQKALDNIPFHEKYQQALQQEIISAHCDLIGAESTGPMMIIQRARDITMAHSLVDSHADIRVLIAGTGHTRNDRGVTYYLKQYQEKARVLSVAFIEVIEEVDQPGDYNARWDETASLPFDIVWFTPRVSRTDPCLHLQKLMEKRQKESHGN